MMEKNKGYWYLPGSNVRIPGEMYMENGVIHLSLYEEINNTDFFKCNQIETIWGITLERKKITLFRCLEVKRNTMSTFIASIAIIGIHIYSFDESKKYSVEIGNNNALSQWFRHDSLNLYYDDENFLHCHQTSESKKERLIPVRDNLNIRLYHTIREEPGFLGLSYTLKQETCARLEYNAPVSLKTTSLDIQLFLEFLSLITLQDIQQHEFTLIDKSINSDAVKTIIFSNRKITNTPKDYLYKFLFDYNTLNSRLDAFLQRYFIDKELRPIAQHLINSYKKKETFTEYTFLNTIQAIDGLYTRYIDEKESIKNILSKVLEMCDYTFIKISDDDKEQIIQSRNYYSHLLPTTKKTAENKVEGVDLYKLDCKLQPILLSLFLQIMGFCHDEINKIVSEYIQ